MNLPEQNRRLRNRITNSSLLTELQNIWDSAEKELHPFQIGKTDQGFFHCIRVESHIWSLVEKHIDKFRDEDLFLLSATAALHDVGKIDKESYYYHVDKDHGKLGAEFLRKDENWKKYFRDETEALAVAYIVGVHSDGKINTIPAEFAWGDPPGILLRSLAAIFRLADMLDSDYRRCPYLAFSFKKLGFFETLRTLWDARRSFSGWQVSSDDQSIVLIVSPEIAEDDRIRALAYIDSLNDSLTVSHKKYLENCRVRYWPSESVSKIKEYTIHLPTRFYYGEYGEDGIKKTSGLIELYTDFARNYLFQISKNFLEVDLRGLGDFSEKKTTRLSKVFIDINIEEYSDWAPEGYETLDKKAGNLITHLSLNKKIPVSKLIDVQGLRSIVILGDPGSGKTTVSQYFCSAFHPSPKASDKIAGIPFHVVIRDFAARKGQNKSLTLLAYISNQITKVVDSTVPLGFAQYWLRKNGSLVIFDGLDEVIRPEERAEVRDLVTEFPKRYSDPRIIVTSRIVGYDEARLDRNKFIHFRLAKLEKPQIAAFVSNFYKEREVNLLEREAAIKGLVEALKEEYVSKLAENPLLLTIMALVHRGEADLPKRRAQLYNKCVEAFMVSRNKAKDLLSYDEYEIRACHEFLGYWIHERAERVSGGSSEVPIKDLRRNLLRNMLERHKEMSQEDCAKKVEEFIDAARKRVGLLVERGEGVWAFGHRSFQEYLAARYIFQNTFGIESLWAEIEDKVERTHWVEPLKLLAGIYGEGSRAIDEFAVRIFDEYGKVDDPLARRLILLGDIAGEIRLKHSLLEPLASETVKHLFNTRNYNVMASCKRILNHFYNTALWTHIVEQITKRARAYKFNPSLFSGTAFASFLSAGKFDDSRVDRILGNI